MSTKYTQPEINTRHEIASNMSHASTCGLDLLRAPHSAGQLDLLGLSRHNFLDNGCMRVHQRLSHSDAGFLESKLNDISAGTTLQISYLNDQWAVIADGMDAANVGTADEFNAKYEMSLDIPEWEPGLTRSAKYTTLTPEACNIYAIRQTIEDYDAATLMGRVVTSSFWFKSTEAGTYAHQCHNNQNARDGHFQAFEYNTPNVWKHYSFTYRMPIFSAMDNQLRWYIVLGGGASETYTYQSSYWNTKTGGFTSSTGNYYRITNDAQLNLKQNASVWITGCKLELGNQHTSFVEAPLNIELDRCKRRFQIVDQWNGTPASIVSGTSLTCNMRLPTQMTPGGHVGRFTARPSIWFKGKHSYYKYDPAANTTTVGQINFNDTTPDTSVFDVAVSRNHENSFRYQINFVNNIDTSCLYTFMSYNVGPVGEEAEFTTDPGKIYVSTETV